jgi:hypothetical protein
MPRPPGKWLYAATGYGPMRNAGQCAAWPGSRLSLLLRVLPPALSEAGLARNPVSNKRTHAEFHDTWLMDLDA